MSKTFLLTTAATFSIALAGTASAVSIDRFETNQETEDVPASAPPPSSSELDGLPVLGGSRDVASINDTGASGGTQATVDANDSGNFSLSNAADTSGHGALTYDGNDDDPTGDGVDMYGLEGEDLTDDGMANFFAFDVVFSDSMFDYDLTVWDGDENTDTFTGMIEAGAGGTTEMISFANFDSVDLMDVGAVQLVFSGDEASDLSIDNLATTAVPIPASLPLLLAGVGGLYLNGRRKKS